MTDFLDLKLAVKQATRVICPKHGTHPHTIHSNIPGHEGYWCQLCWLESLGPCLPTVEQPTTLHP